MGGKSQPDFGDVAAAQGAENREVVRDQLFANRPDMYTPFGYQSWSQTPYTDPATGQTSERWQMTQGLTPELQEILNKQTAIQSGRTDIAGMLTGRMANEFGQQMDFSNLTSMAETPQMQQTLGEGPIADPYQTRQAAENSVYNQAMSRLTPQFESQRSALEIKMRNQGLQPGDEAWNSQMGNLNQQQTDANNQALWSANQAGRSESGQMFDMQMGRNQNAFNQALGANNQNFQQMMQSAGFQNQNRQQQLSEAMQQRGFSLNEINALLNGQQVGMPQMPNFNTGQAAQPAPIMQGAAQQASMENASNPWNAISGLAGQALGGYIGAGGNFGVG